MRETGLLGKFVAFVLSTGMVVAPPLARAAELKRQTLDAFQKYIRDVEAEHQRRVQPGGPFLWTDESPDRLKLVQQGGIAVAPMRGGESKVPGGLIHHWISAMFVAGVTVDRALAVVHDYDRHQWIYRPDVLRSKLLSRGGNEYRATVRLLRSKLVTVVLDADYEIRYVPLDRNRWYSDSRSVSVREVENAGTARERAMPDGTGRGYVWRLYTHSRFEERDGGVYVECEVISLSRDYPFGMAWMIRPLVQRIPGESLTKMLSDMRTAVLEVQSGRLRAPRPVAP